VVVTIYWGSQTSTLKSQDHRIILWQSCELMGGRVEVMCKKLHNS
jgi:hypothetical protein